MGSLEVIVGTMFSGKSTELILRANKYAISGISTQVFRPSRDIRTEQMVSHDGLKIPAAYAANAQEIVASIKPETKVIAIDEAQFFDSSIIEHCVAWADADKTVIVAGLLRDFRDQPFPFADRKATMYDLLRYADDITHKSAICTFAVNGSICSRPASKAQRILADGKIAPANTPTVQLGGKESYAARCRMHYVKIE